MRPDRAVRARGRTRAPRARADDRRRLERLQGCAVRRREARRSRRRHSRPRSRGGATSAPSRDRRARRSPRARCRPGVPPGRTGLAGEHPAQCGRGARDPLRSRVSVRARAPPRAAGLLHPCRRSSPWPRRGSQSPSSVDRLVIAGQIESAAKHSPAPSCAARSSAACPARSNHSAASRRHRAIQPVVDLASRARARSRAPRVVAGDRLGDLCAVARRRRPRASARARRGGGRAPLGRGSRSRRRARGRGGTRSSGRTAASGDGPMTSARRRAARSVLAPSTRADRARRAESAAGNGASPRESRARRQVVELRRVDRLHRLRKRDLRGHTSSQPPWSGTSVPTLTHVRSSSSMKRRLPSERPRCARQALRELRRRPALRTRRAPASPRWQRRPGRPPAGPRTIRAPSRAGSDAPLRPQVCRRGSALRPAKVHERRGGRSPAQCTSSISQTPMRSPAQHVERAHPGVEASCRARRPDRLHPRWYRPPGSTSPCAPPRRITDARVRWDTSRWIGVVLSARAGGVRSRGEPKAGRPSRTARSPGRMRAPATPWRPVSWR